MKIIKSKYTSKELYSLYEEESSKTRYGLEWQVDGFVASLFFICFGIPIIITLFVILSGINIIYENVFVKVIGIILLFTGIVILFTHNKIHDAIINHYKRKGIQLESPLDGIYSYIRLIECGELVQAAQSKSIELQPAIDGHSLYFLAKNPSTGILERYGDAKINIFDHALNKVVPEPGICDFSIYDNEIEERLAKIQKRKER